MTIVLLGIASISLIVSGFGIVNTMLMTVIERTKEIGTMKAIGATNNFIIKLFLIESGIIGLLGGILGSIVGFLVSFLITKSSFEFLGISLDVSFDPFLMIGAITFSTIIGMISGTYPAYRASKLNPVEALRYE